MSSKTTTEYFCDVCGAVIPNYKKEHRKKYSMPVRFYTEQTEGKGCPPYYSNVSIDLCDACLDKAVNINAWGAMGYNTYEFRKASKTSAPTAEREIVEHACDSE